MYGLSIVVCPFVLLLLDIVLSVLLRYTYSDCPFGIFKLLVLFKWRKVYISLPKDTTNTMTTVLLQVSLYNEHVLIYLCSDVIFVGQLVI